MRSARWKLKCSFRTKDKLITVLCTCFAIITGLTLQPKSKNASNLSTTENSLRSFDWVISYILNGGFEIHDEINYSLKINEIHNFLVEFGQHTNTRTHIHCTQWELNSIYSLTTQMSVIIVKMPSTSLLCISTKFI